MSLPTTKTPTDNERLAVAKTMTRSAGVALSMAYRHAMQIKQRKLRREAFEFLRGCVQEALEAELWFDNEDLMKELSK